MGKELLDNKKHFVKKSNIIVRAVTNQTAGIMTQRLFNFLIKTVQNSLENEFKTNKHKIHFFISDFCKYFAINQNGLYNPIIYKQKETTVLKKEIDELTSLKFEFLDETNNKYDLVNLFNSGGYYNGIIYVEPNINLFKKHCIDLKKDYTNIFLPYTKEVTSKYSMRLYEYLRSYLYVNAKTKGVPNYRHEWSFEKLAKILNLTLNHSYFKNITMLKSKILEPVKKDLAKTDIFFDYQLIKTSRKYNKIILRTVLDKKKFLAQNPEKEKSLSKKNKTNTHNKTIYVNQTKETIPNNYVDNDSEYNTFVKTENRLSQEEIKQILEEFDNS